MFSKSVGSVLRVLCIVFLFAICLSPVSAQAAYPEKSVLIVVPYSPGGGVDILFRLVSKHIEPILGKSLIVENKPGAGGQVGWTFVTQARSDGYTLGATSLPSMNLIKSLRGDSVPFEMEDFQYICNLQADPIVWVVQPDSKFKTAQDVIDFAKENPGKLNVAGDGPQSNVQLQQLMIDKQMNVSTNFVPFSGSNPAVTAILGGKVDMCASSLGASLPHIQSGKLRALVIFSEKRMGVVQDVPTATEAFGVDVPSTSIALRGVIAPKNMEPDHVATLEKAFKQLCETPEFIKQAEELGVFLQYMGSEEFKNLTLDTSKVVEDYKSLF